MVSRFSKRSSLPEIMDDLQCTGEVVNQTLRELEVINKWLGGNAVTLSGIKKLIEKRKGLEAISITDIGCGSGYMLRELARWGRQNNISLNLVGIDANPHIIDFARSSAKDYPEIDFKVDNIFSEDFSKNKFDIIMATLFTHHFKDDELIILLHALKDQSNIGIVINDLHRHWFAYHSIKVLTRFFSKSEMVKYDAPLSVLRAFSRNDLRSILSNAGISEYTLTWKWAFRWQLVIPTSLA